MNLLSKTLPRLYLITPNPDDVNDSSTFINQLEKSLATGIQLVQFRAKNLTPEKYQTWAIKVLACCDKYNAALILNADHSLLNEVNAQGIHLDGIRLNSYQHRPINADKLVSAACHSLEQIKKAEALGADIVTLSPVLATKTHPEAVPLGWGKFSFIANQTRLPVYALGGMNSQLLERAQENRAYGIAGIRSFWGD